MDKHTSYFKILESLQDAKECPLCKLEVEAQNIYLDSILYEAVTDPRVRSELVNSGGYCRRHAHHLVKMRDNLGTAIIYQDQIKLLMDFFDKKTSNELKRKSQSKNDDLNCPACSNQLETRRNYLHILRDGLQQREMKQAYESSAGFCIPHLTIFLESVKDQAAQVYLYNIEQHNLSNLWDELQEFIRKHDYRFQDETYGNESDSWLRAIKKMHGSEDVF